MAVNSSQPVNVAPFAESDIHSLGNSNNWPELRRILGSVSEPSFGVTNCWTQAVVDDARSRFDSCCGGEFGRNVLQTLVASPDRSGMMGAMVELLLSVGVDPDMMELDGLRPSHMCAQLGDLRATKAILYCRPDLEALNSDDATPRGVAMQVEKFAGDDEFPERLAGRKDVADFIKNEKLERWVKSLSDLAVRQEWFAVKNLIRRQVIAASEYEQPAFGKTAAEWADHFGKKLIAEELRYYASLPSAKLLDEEEKVENLEERIGLLEAELAGKQETIKLLREQRKDAGVGDLAGEVKAELDAVEGKFQEKVKFLEDRCMNYEEKIKTLSEAVASFTASAAERSSDGEPGSKRLKLEIANKSVVGNGHESSSNVE